MRPSQLDYARARESILDRFCLLLDEGDLLCGTCFGRFAHGGIGVVFDPWSLIVGHGEDEERGCRNVGVLLEALHDGRHRSAATLSDTTIWSGVPSLSKLCFGKRNSVDAGKPGLQGTEAGQVRFIGPRWRRLRIRDLLKFIKCSSLAVIECVLIPRLEITQSRDALGISAPHRTQLFAAERVSYQDRPLEF